MVEEFDWLVNRRSSRRWIKLSERDYKSQPSVKFLAGLHSAQLVNKGYPYT